jgi:hypothetical protein
MCYARNNMRPLTPEQAAKREQSTMQAYLKKKPLTSQEQEQRRSQSVAWEAGGGTGTNPYENLPEGRMKGFANFKIQRNRQMMNIVR